MSTKNLKEAFECELCVDGFNQYDRRPITQVPCGHTICLKCLNKLEINRSQCPFCRVEVEQKIPNWEIIKRLPKPSVPLIYDQIKVKLDQFSARVNQEYFTTSSDILKTVELLGILTELMNKESEAPPDPEKGKPLDKKQEFIENLQAQQTFLNTFRAKKLEYGGFLNYKLNMFKKDIDKEDNKFNEQNLKVIKADIENLNKNLNSKLEFIKESNKKLIQLLQAITQNSTFRGFDENTALLEEELKEMKRFILLTQQADVPSHGSNASNVVRPQSTTSNSTPGGIPGSPEALALDHKQKGNNSCLTYFCCSLSH